MASIEERLDRLESHETIRKLVARYAIGADRQNDPAIMAGLFHDDALWEAPGFSRFCGRDAIAAGLAEIGQSQILWSLHYMVSPYIELEKSGDRASCHWYLWELATMAQEQEGAADSWLGGWYESTVERRGPLWAFSRVKLDLRLQGKAAPPWDTKVTRSA